MACILPNLVKMKYQNAMDLNKTKHLINLKDFLNTLITNVNIAFFVLFCSIIYAHHDISMDNISCFCNSDISSYEISKISFDTLKDKFQRSDELIMKDRTKFFSHSLQKVKSISPNAENGFIQKILVLSGKKKVGKSFLSMNLAEALSVYDKKVLLVNCDYRNSKTPSLEIVQIPSIEEIVCSFSELEILQLTKNLNYLPDFQNGIGKILNKRSPKTNYYDYIIFDTCTGLNAFNLGLLQNSDLGLVVSTADPGSIHDTYILIKALQPYLKDVNLRLVINQISEDKQYEKLYEDLRIALNQFLGYELGLIGKIPFDDEVIQKKLDNKKSKIEHFSPAIIHIRKIANLLSMVNLNRNKKLAQGCEVS